MANVLTPEEIEAKIKDFLYLNLNPNQKEKLQQEFENNAEFGKFPHGDIKSMEVKLFVTVR